MRDIQSEDSKALDQVEHNSDASAKRVQLRAQDPETGEWVNISAVDNGDGTYSLSSSAPTSEGILDEIASLVSNLSFLSSVQGIAADLRVTLLSGTVTTVTSVTTVATLSNQTNMGGFAATNMVMNAADTAYATGIRSNIITG